MGALPLINLPKYTDDEVRKFHPVLEQALNKAIEELGLVNEFEVRHHDSIGSLTPDFAIKNKRNGHYIFFIEVKRQPGDVSSTRYRNQAKSYVTEAGFLAEKKYYALTNLELIDLFKYSDDSARTLVLQQLIKPSPIRVGNLETDVPLEFFNNLVNNLKNILQIVIEDTGEYHNISSKFINVLQSRKNDYHEWHKVFVVAGYEYIRGALKDLRRLDWQIANNYISRPQRIIEIGKDLDFQDIFKAPAPSSEDGDLWDLQFLRDMNKSGTVRKSGDEIAEIAHYIITQGLGQDGVVTTDAELARILAISVRYVTGRELNIDEKVCDPAAGIGSLLTSISAGFHEITPSQLWANDKENLFLEPLSIKLGLAFPATINSENSPKITIKNILKLENNDFANVKIIVMNPPYIAGIKCYEERRLFANKINEITHTNAKLNVGQIGLEALFIELTLALTKQETVVGIVLPKQYLNAKGPEAQAFRRFLLNEFGLSCIAIYPREGLFESVTKATVLIIGKKGVLSSCVNVIEFSLPLEQVDPDKLLLSLNSTINTEESQEIGYGINIKSLSSVELQNKISSGWRFITTIGNKAENWINEYLRPCCDKLDSSDFSAKRGRLGNTGGSDLIFPDSNAIIWKSLQGHIPMGWLYPALRTVDEINSPLITDSTVKSHVLCPPINAFDSKEPEFKILVQIIKTYIANTDTSKGRQSKKIKTIDDLIKIVLATSRMITPTNTVLIPRNIRRNARGFIACQNMYVSTNVIEVFNQNVKKQKLLLSWILSIFAQLHFEVLSKDQEGTRKNELEEQVKQLYIPKFDDITDNQKQKILEAMSTFNEFNDLCNPSITELDRVWAEILWPNSQEKILNSAKNLLEDIVFERYPECKV